MLPAQRTTHFHVFHALQPVSYTTIDGVCVCVVARETCVLRMDSERGTAYISIYIYNDNTSKKTFSGGCLGSRNDEERSEMRYVMRIAESSESSRL